MIWRRNKQDDVLAQLKKKFGALVPDPVVSLAFHGLDASLEDSPVDFVFLLIEDASARQFKVLASKAIQITTEHKAILVGNAGGFMQLATGPRVGISDSSTYRISLAAELAGVLGSSGRVVHGRTFAHVGTVGTDARKTWGFFPRQMSKILEALLAAPPGTSVDLGEV